MRIKITNNQVIEYLVDGDVSKTIRVLHVEPFDNNITIIDVTDKTALPEWVCYDEICSDIEQGEARFAKLDEYAAPVFSEDDLDSKNYRSLRSRRNKARDVIQSLVGEENKIQILFAKSRSRLVEQEVETHKVSRQTIYGWLRKFWQGGMTFNALIPCYHKCGARGQQRKFTDKKPGEKGSIAKKYNTRTGVVMNDEWREIIVSGGRLFYENLRKRTLKEAYDLTLERFCSKRDKKTGELILPDPNKGEVFSFRQFCYHYKKEVGENLRRVLKARHGQRNFNVNIAERTGTFREGIYGPGSLCQIDATTADTNLVSELDIEKIIGRPTIYVALDSFGIRVQGVAVRLESENWMGYREVIINIVEDKVSFCAEYGIVIKPEDWQNSNLPDQLLADRGAMEGKTAESLVYGPGTQLSNTASRRPDWKAYVEQFFNLMNIKVIHHLPGAVPQEPQPGEKDYRLDSLLTLREFTRIVLQMVINFNKNHRMKNFKMDADMIADNLEPYPNDIYEWGCINRSVPTRQHSLEEVETHLLPNEEATVTEHGIRFRNLYYTSEQAVNEGWQLRAKELKSWKIRVAFHPRKVEPVYIRFGNGQPSVKCYLKNRQSPFLNCEWKEVETYFRLKNAKNKNAEGRTRQSDSDLRNVVGKILKGAKKNKTQSVNSVPKQSNASRLNAIAANKKAEIEFEHQFESAKATDDSLPMSHLDITQETDY